MGALLAILNAGLPHIIAVWKALKEQNPNDPALTDDQVIELLSLDAKDIVAKADDWLAQHPKP